MSSNNIDSFVDDTYLVALINEEPLPISDEKYAHELTLQEVLFSSSTSFSSVIPEQNCSKIIDVLPSSKGKGKEKGESSRNRKNLVICGICMDYKEALDMFSGLTKCNHVFCVDCVVQYVTSKIEENIALVECPYPKCNSTIEPEDCATVLPKEVFSRWENALCEAMILGSQKFYCPYKECSTMMVNDAVEAVTQSECPSCRRLFCASCHVKWHVGFTCHEFQSLKENERGGDDLVIKLAKEMKWKKCSNCGFIVDKKDGCVHMTCRCHYEFCYQCGGKWSSVHTCEA